MKSNPPDLKLLDFANEKQAGAVRAWHKYGTAGKAAGALGISVRSVMAMVARLKGKAQSRGYAPEFDQDKPVPPGQRVGKVSTLYGSQGEVKSQWVQAVPDPGADRIEAIRAAMDQAAEKYKKALPKIRAPTKTLNKHLLELYPMGDPHIGLYTSAAEVGAAFDLEIARATLIGAVDKLAYLAPPAERAIILTVGDTTHNNDHRNRTPKSGHYLDVDGRMHEILDVAVDTLIHTIIRAAASHKFVDVYICSGNHDPMPALFLRKCLAMAFKGTDRITVNVEPRAYHYATHGSWLFGFTHGDKCKPDRLGSIMAAHVPKLWGASKWRVWHTGHVHHTEVRQKEHAGWRFESHNTLAPADAHAVEAGYVSERTMSAITYHEHKIRTVRHTIGVDDI